MFLPDAVNDVPDLYQSEFPRQHDHIRIGGVENHGGHVADVRLHGHMDFQA